MAWSCVSVHPSGGHFVHNMVYILLRFPLEIIRHLSNPPFKGKMSSVAHSDS
jgi:hypothetical protein